MTKKSKSRGERRDVMHHEMGLLKAAPEALQRRLIDGMTPASMLAFDADFEIWAHRNQLPPGGDGWRVWLMMAGRGFGKTRAGAEWIYKLASGKAGMQIALVGATIGDARSIMVEGVSGLLSVARRFRRRLNWEPSLNRIRWPNGSEAKLFSGDNADGLRGPEHHIAWADELAKWRQPDETWDNLQFGLRRGPRPRALVTTTPRSMPLLTRIDGLDFTITTNGRTSDNINVDQKVIELLTASYAGTRIGRQELDGELIEDAEGALWTWAMIEAARVTLPFERGEYLDRIVVGVDPPASVGGGADECGIVVAGSSGGKLYVLEDATVQGLSPEGWANRVAAAAARWNAGLVVAEANNGGAMVASVLKAADSGLKVRLVHASLGKSARAEPVALKFEAGKAFLVGEFRELEAQLTGMIAGGGYEGPGKSPDRADAMVWALTALSETRSGLPRVRRL